MSRLARLLAVPLIAASAATGTFAGNAGNAVASSTYIVRSGDSLGRIAARLDVPLDDLLRVNHLTIRSVIHPGQQLIVPGTGGSSGGASGSGYVIKAGDSLGRIAGRLGVSLDALLRANDLTVSSLILPGQRLTIPGGGSTGGGGSGGGSASSAGDARGGSYVIKSGDWLGRIAVSFGVSLDALLRANDLTVSSLILPGQRLTIPGGGSTSSGGSTGGGGGSTVGGGTAGGSYVVRPGDYLARIAAEHGVTLNALLAANQMTVTSLILPGQAINIPTGGGGASPTPSPAPSPAPSGSVSIKRVLNYAVAQVGKPWRFFSRGPTHFDCSGLTTAAYAQIGVSLTHQSAWQARQGVAVDFHNEPIRAGDLVFQDTDGDGIINHVGIALNSTTWVQARSSRSGVSVGRLPADSNIVAVRRVITS